MALLALAVAAPVDLNSAGVDALAAVPGIGPDKAAEIVAWRDRYGSFASIAELDPIPGVGQATLRAIRPFVVLRPAVDSTVRARPITFDPNTATEPDLARVVGIGGAKARAIVADRLAHGAFATCADLVRVPGIGPATVAAVAERCVTE